MKGMLMDKKTKANQLLNDRDSMIRVADKVAVHISADDYIIISFSDVSSESYSFALAPDAAIEISEGLRSAALVVKENSNFH